MHLSLQQQTAVHLHISVFVCVCVCVCLTKLKRRGNLSSVFSLLILVYVCVLVWECARVLVFFFLQLFNVADLKELFKSLDNDDSTRSSALFVNSKVHNFFITFRQTDSDSAFGLTTRKWERGAVARSWFKFGDKNQQQQKQQQQQEQWQRVEQLCL